MKRMLLGLALACAASPSFATYYCQMDMFGPTDILPTLQSVALPISEQQCDLLKRNKLVLNFDGMTVAATDKGYNIAWVTVDVMDPVTRSVSEHTYRSMIVSPSPSQKNATDALVDAYKGALKGLPLEAAVNDVLKRRQQIAAKK